MPNIDMNHAIIIYISVVSVLSFLITVLDKAFAIAGFWRVPEKALLFLGIIGGSAAMLAAMLVVRHKTRKPKFMLSLPLLMLLHAAVAGILIWNPDFTPFF